MSYLPSDPSSPDSSNSSSSPLHPPLAMSPPSSIEVILVEDSSNDQTSGIPQQTNPSSVLQEHSSEIETVDDSDEHTQGQISTVDGHQFLHDMAIDSDEEADPDPVEDPFLEFEQQMANYLENELEPMELPPPAYNIDEVKLTIDTILTEALPFFVTGAPAMMVPPNHPLGEYPLTHSQITALTSLNRTVARRHLAIQFIIQHLSFPTLILLQLVHDNEAWINTHERTRLVLCLLIGFLAYHWDDEYVFDFLHFTSAGNVLAVNFVLSNAEHRPLSPNIAHIGTMMGTHFNFTLLSVFSRMAPGDMPPAHLLPQ